MKTDFMNWLIYPGWIAERSTTMPLIKTKRVYDKHSKADGYRVLIDRLWPRGLSKEDAGIDEWAKELAPTKTLRYWFDHDPYRWEEFKKKYKAELKLNTAVDDFVERHKGEKTITLIYATKYDNLTHAIIFKQLLESRYRNL